MEYEETLLLLDGIVGAYAVVYPGRPDLESATFGGHALLAAGILRRDRETDKAGAIARRQAITSIPDYRKWRPELDLGGEMPLEGYERQAASYTFEGMDDLHGRGAYAGFTLWQVDFVKSQWLDLPVRPDWLGIWLRDGGLVLAAEFPS